MNSKTQATKGLRRLLDFHAGQIQHFERGIQGWQAAIDNPHSPGAVANARRQIIAYQAHIASHRQSIISLEESIAREEKDYV